jgi:pyrroloquinoline quinone biosynthesis protein D
VRLQIDRVTGKLALLYPEGVLLLNATGAAIVELCKDERTLGEIHAALAERYDAPPDPLARDVAEYLLRLRDRGLIDWRTDEVPER